MKALVHSFFILVTVLLVAGCARRAYSEAIAGKQALVPAFFQVINTGSRNDRLQAEARAWQSVQDPNASPETRAFGAEVTRFKLKADKGETSPEEFEIFCKTVEILIGDYIAANEAENQEAARQIRFAIRLTAGNPYLSLEAWAPVKRELTARQKWAGRGGIL
jgi:hypothetical protein